jgi:cytochrome b6-f complex iron-sulfur subunit
MNKKEESEDIKGSISRRGILGKWAWGVLLTLGLLEFSWVTGSLFRARQRRSERNRHKDLIDAGRVEQYSPGKVRAVPQGQFYVSCLEDGSFIALSRTCTHLGCSVPWNEEKKRFICPCHASSFDLRGQVLAAPATRPLDYFPIKIENGLLKVDVTKPLKRDKFDMQQTVKI